jgi:hypothetical protein
LDRDSYFDNMYVYAKLIIYLQGQELDTGH